MVRPSWEPWTHVRDQQHPLTEFWSVAPRLAEYHHRETVVPQLFAADQAHLRSPLRSTFDFPFSPGSPTRLEVQIRVVPHGCFLRG